MLGTREDQPAAAGRAPSRPVIVRLFRWFSPGADVTPVGEPRRCAGCRYPFPGGAQGAPAPCSKCGRFIDPAAAGALAAEGPHIAMRAAMHAPGLVFLVLVIATCGTLLYAGTVPGYLFDPQVFGIAGAVVLAGIAILRFVLACGVGFACGRLREVLRQRGWWACVAVAAATALMVALDVPGRVGFAWHRGELEAIVAGWDRDSGLPAANHAGQRFTIDRGLFDEVPIEPWTLVARNAADGDAPDGASPEWRGLIVIAQGTGFIANRGFYLYLPAMSADTARDFGLRHLEGPWYSFVRTG